MQQSFVSINIMHLVVGQDNTETIRIPKFVKRGSGGGISSRLF